MKFEAEMSTTELVTELNRILNNDNFIDEQANMNDEDVANDIVILGVHYQIMSVVEGDAPIHKGFEQYAEAHLNLQMVPSVNEVALPVTKVVLESLLYKLRTFCKQYKISY